MAVANYHEAHGCYPPAYLVDDQGRPAHSWRVLILPYIEQDGLYEEYDFSEPWDGPNNRKLAARMPKSYRFPGEEHPGNTTTNYLAVVGPGTVWPGRTTVSLEVVSDGPENTILIVENRDLGVHWMEPRDLSFADMDFNINSSGGISSPYGEPAVAMLDGSVRQLHKGVTPGALRGLFTISGGEKLAPDGEVGWRLLPDGRQREPAPR